MIINIITHLNNLVREIFVRFTGPKQFKTFNIHTNVLTLFFYSPIIIYFRFLFLLSKLVINHVYKVF